MKGKAILKVRPEDLEAHRRYIDGRWDEDESGCWLWRGVVLTTGYGQANRGSSKWLVHRLSYEVFVGPIPDGLTVDHLCRVRKCINPAHLEAVTAWENVTRTDNPVAANLEKVTCPRGHRYTHVDRRGWRKCRTCLRMYARNRAARLRLQRSGDAA